MNTRNPLLDSVDELLGHHRQPLHRYLFTRPGLRDWAVGTLLGACSMLLSAALAYLIGPL